MMVWVRVRICIFGKQEVVVVGLVKVYLKLVNEFDLGFVKDSEWMKLLSEIMKVYGDSVIFDGDGFWMFKYILIGVFLLDFVLGGGVFEGLIFMFFGWQLSGKLIFVLCIVVNV